MSVATADVLTFSLRGRAARSAYVAGVFLALASGAAAGTMFAAGTELPASTLATALTAFSALFGLAAAGLLVSCVVRRLHDISYGGFAALVLLVPLANVVCVALLALWPGKRGANRFGPDPRASIEEGAQAYDEPNASARTSSDVVDAVVDVHEASDAPASIEPSPETVAGPSPDAVPLLTTESPIAMDDSSRTARPSRSSRSNAGSNTRSGARAAAKPAVKSSPNSRTGSKPVKPGAKPVKPKAQPKPKAPETAEPVEAVEVVDEAEARCERVWEAARASIVDENLSVRLQVKVRSVDKLRKLLDKGRITPEHFKRWKMRIMEL